MKSYQIEILQRRLTKKQNMEKCMSIRECIKIMVPLLTMTLVNYHLSRYKPKNCQRNKTHLSQLMKSYQIESGQRRLTKKEIMKTCMTITQRIKRMVPLLTMNRVKCQWICYDPKQLSKKQRTCVVVIEKLPNKNIEAPSYQERIHGDMYVNHGMYQEHGTILDHDSGKVPTKALLY